VKRLDDGLPIHILNNIYARYKKQFKCLKSMI